MNVIGTRSIPKEGYLEISYESPMFNTLLEGKFKVRRRKLDDEGKISQMLHSLTNGTEIIDSHQRAKLTAIATLSIVVAEYPDWWKEVEEYADMNTIVHVYAKYNEWILRPFRKEGDERDRKDSNID